MKSLAAIGSIVLPLVAFGGRPALAAAAGRLPRPGPAVAEWTNPAVDRLPLPPVAQLVPHEPLPAAFGTPPLSAPPAVPSPPLTLEELERIALQNNPTLVQAGMAVRAAQGRHVQAGLCPNPVIGYRAEDIGDIGASGLQGGFALQKIVTSGKLRLGRAVASHEVQQARYGWQAQRRRVLNDVRAAYYEVLLAQKMIEVNAQLLHIGEEGVKVTEQLRAVQEIGRAEVLQARIEAEKAQLSLARSRYFHQMVWRRLAAVVGRPAMVPVHLAGDAASELPALNREDTFSRLLSLSPELAQARTGVERARCELALQNATRFPNFEIEAGAKYNDASRFTVADVAVGVPLPLLNRNQGNIASAWARLIAARSEVRRVELQLCDRFAAAFGPYANAWRQVDTYGRTILPNAKASLDLITIGYREGEFGYLALLTAQRTYFNVSLEYLTNLRELRARTVQLEGMLLSGGLQQVK